MGDVDGDTVAVGVAVGREVGIEDGLRLTEGAPVGKLDGDVDGAALEVGKLDGGADRALFDVFDFLDRLRLLPLFFESLAENDEEGLGELVGNTKRFEADIPFPLVGAGVAPGLLVGDRLDCDMPFPRLDRESGEVGRGLRVDTLEALEPLPELELLFLRAAMEAKSKLGTSSKTKLTGV